MTSGNVVAGEELSAYMVGSADGVQLGPAAAETVTQERERRLRELAAAFRIFGTFGSLKGWPDTSRSVTRNSPTRFG